MGQYWGEFDCQRSLFFPLTIGVQWAGGCVVGASYAAKQLNRRCVLFTGMSSYGHT